MRTKQKQMEMKFEVEKLPPPTVPPITWAESRAEYKRGPVVSAPQEAVDYFKKYIGGRETEAFLTMYLDNRNHVLDVILNGEGTVDHAACYPREILRKAIELNATGLILSHNLCGASHKLCYVRHLVMWSKAKLLFVFR